MRPAPAVVDDSPLGRFLAVAGKRQRAGSGYLVCCKAHGDKTPSLSITSGDDGRVLLKCHAGCSTEDIVSSFGLQMSDLYPERAAHLAPVPRLGVSIDDMVARTHIERAIFIGLGWVDAEYHGVPCIDIPYEQPDGTTFRVRVRRALSGDKRFAWREGQGVRAYDPDHGRLARERNEVAFVEGESDVAACLGKGIPAIGCPGANSAHTIQGHHIEGLERVFIVRETDQAGELFVAAVRERVSELGFKGAVHELRMPDGTKDPCALHARDPSGFKEKIERALREAVEAAKPKPAGLSPADIVNSWLAEGPLTRVATGIEPLDDLCLGGLPVPWRLMLIGAPSAGKTFFEVAVANRMARAAEQAGMCVGILAVDEEPDDVTIRLVQLAGFSISDAERRDPDVLAEMADALKSMRLRLYDSSQTIEGAARDLAAVAESEGRKAALFVDSLHAVMSEAAAGATSSREHVDGNVRAIRTVSDTYKMLVVTTVEANRAAYRDDDAAENTNDLAAGAESRSIEFGAQTQLVLRTPKGFPDIVHVRVAKNRRAKRGEFWLAMDRERHTLTPCGNPKDNPQAAEQAHQAKQAANRAGVEANARTLLKVCIKNPGLTERGLRALLKTEGIKMGVDSLDAAQLLLQRDGVDGYRLVNRGSKAASKWFAEPNSQLEGDRT